MKKIISILIVVLISTVFTCALYAQSTTVKLPTANNTSSFNVTDNNDAFLLRMFGDGGFYTSGTYGTGSISVTGAGTRMMWYPMKAAFRAGKVNSTQWNDVNIGDYSTAMGFNTTASNIASTALGYWTTASGNSSTAIGYWANASGGVSTALGYYATASGSSSFATSGATASGDNSIAIGTNTYASGQYSTAIGTFVSTNSKQGAFIIGDYWPSALTYSSANNEMTMRFVGGYRLFTNTALTTGVTLSAGGGSWSSVSDARKKEQFVKADGEYFLNSVARLKLGSWNYIGQDAKTFRHYGPMAQEIFKYFGNDGIGTIGNDTTLASADMDGIIMICLQALGKRTVELDAALNELIAEKEKVIKLQTSFNDLKEEIAKMKNDIRSLTEVKNEQENNNISLNTINKGQ